MNVHECSQTCMCMDVVAHAAMHGVLVSDRDMRIVVHVDVHRGNTWEKSKMSMASYVKAPCGYQLVGLKD